MPRRTSRSPMTHRRLCPDCGMPVEMEPNDGFVSCCAQEPSQSTTGGFLLPFILLGGLVICLWWQSMMIMKIVEIVMIQERILSEMSSAMVTPHHQEPSYPSTPCPPRVLTTPPPPPEAPHKCPLEDNTAVQAEVERLINQYDADKTAKSDFALETAGGRILSTRSTKPYGDLQWPWCLLSPLMCSTTNMAANMLRTGVQPGQCWPFSGHTGEAVVQLLAAVHVEGLAVEHIPASISPTQEISSAPKTFSLWGLRSKHDDAASGHLFGEYEYHLTGPPLQHFPVQHLTTEAFSIVLFRVTSNWGHPDYTCVYRLRIHGELTHRQ